MSFLTPRPWRSADFKLNWYYTGLTAIPRVRRIRDIHDGIVAALGFRYAPPGVWSKFVAFTLGVIREGAIDRGYPGRVG